MEVDDNGDGDDDEERRRDGKDVEGEEEEEEVLCRLIAATLKGLGGTAKRANCTKQTTSRIGN
ncbi:hypothetical protein TWF788_008966 [Orbilia oligospora]|uniref:Uncharacterized protein n=1 Tax=Orbilia oligospora TaxID=2813651 RepID=A0A7C8U5A1_ORBOL|nr:hypothetical protein TWF788_008966 [Orbilia oligospora]